MFRIHSCLTGMCLAVAIATTPAWFVSLASGQDSANLDLHSSQADEELLPVPAPVEGSNLKLRYERVPGGYRLAAGDTLAIIVHGVIGEFGKAPTHYPRSSDDDLLPATGYPIQVDSSGHLRLPELPPLPVTGLNVVEAQDLIGNAYLDAKVTKKKHIVMLSLLRKRKVHTTLLHTSSAGSRAESVSLDADQADLLSALATAKSFDSRAMITVSKPVVGGQLANGSVVHLQSPTQAYYYTGGMLAGGQHTLPTDRPFNALQAISAAGGYSQRLLHPKQLTIIPQHGAARRVPIRDLLNRPDAYPVQPGDHLIVR